MNKLLSIEKKLLSNPNVDRVPMLLKIKESMPSERAESDDPDKKKKDEEQKRVLQEKYPAITKYLKKHKVDWFDIPFKKLMNIKDLTQEEGQILSDEFVTTLSEHLKIWGFGEVMDKVEIEAVFKK